jgi:hypothetical protein
MTNHMEDCVFLFDMDGSMADHDSALLEGLNMLKCPGEEEVNLWAEDHPQYILNRIRLIRNQPGWWLNLKPISLGLKMYELAIQMGFIAEVLTKGPRNPNAWKEKVEWCNRYLRPDTDVHIVSDRSEGDKAKSSGKGRFYGRVLYDDYGPFMLKWLRHRPRGLGIMPVNAHNKDFDHPNVLRYDGSPESLAIVKEALSRTMARKPGEPFTIADLK